MRAIKLQRCRRSLKSRWISTALPRGVVGSVGARQPVAKAINAKHKTIARIRIRFLQSRGPHTPLCDHSTQIDV